MQDKDQRNFELEEPKHHNGPTRYACLMTTNRTDLFDFVKSLSCVADVQMDGEERGLISIIDEHDADEAWHYIRSELEDEARMVPLDKIWQDAISWL